MGRMFFRISIYLLRQIIAPGASRINASRDYSCSAKQSQQKAFLDPRFWILDSRLSSIEYLVSPNGTPYGGALRMLDLSESLL
jgi:hypothetical protein